MVTYPSTSRRGCSRSNLYPSSERNAHKYSSSERRAPAEYTRVEKQVLDSARK